MTTRFTMTALATLLIAPLITAIPAAAQAPQPAPQAAAAGKGGPLEACRADVDKLCAKAERTQGWRGKCLRENATALSDGCKSAIVAVREGREKVRAACSGDIATLCKTEGDSKDARPMSCLKTNEAKLSAGCKTAFTAFTSSEPEGDAPATKQ